MESFIIEGGHPLKGTITPQGAKNEALQVICTTILTDEPVRITNVPDILDVNNLIKLLQEIGVKVTKHSRHDYTFQSDELKLDYLDSLEFVKKCSSLRGSVLMIGPLLGRCGKATIAQPGGDKIGRRRLDTHFLGFKYLGANFVHDDERNVYQIQAKKLKGCYMLLDEASVTGTANIIMASVLAKGTTTIYNAACEPYIQQLCHLLNAMGAQISGIASNLLTIVGVDKLHGAEHRILPDMIEVGSFIGMAAMCGEGVRIKNVSVKDLGIIPDAFRRLGVKIKIEDDDLVIPEQKHYVIDSFIDGTIMTLADAPWPGLTPDLLSVLLVVATQARGSVLFHQKMFESRLFFVDKLIDMGAQIILCDPHRAVVVGHDHKIKLRAGRMTSPDIRAGIALLIAAMSANGTSRIANIAQIDRGYEDIEHRLNALLRVGPYTFSRYKVAWRYIARSFITAVIAPMQDPYLGETLPLPNEKVIYVGTDCREEAYYLCGILSSAPVRCCVTCYMNPTSISAHVLDKLHIPAFDPADSRHLSIAALCEEGHRASDPRCQDAVRQQLDRAVAALYGLTSADLDTVRSMLEKI